MSSYKKMTINPETGLEEMATWIDGGNDWKWYNNGYYDCFQDMKISVEKKLGITINKLN